MVSLRSMFLYVVALMTRERLVKMAPKYYDPSSFPQGPMRTDIERVLDRLAKKAVRKGWSQDDGEENDDGQVVS